MENIKFKKVIVFSGAAGGISREAIVNLRIEGQADTVEEVRKLVEATPDLLAACKKAEFSADDSIDGQTGNDVWISREAYEAICAAIAKARR